MFDWNRWHLYQQAMSPWHWGMLVVGIVVSIWLIFWLRSYFCEDSENADGTLEMLSQFRELHQEGGLSDDEFRLIKSRLATSAQKTLLAGKAITVAVSADAESARRTEQEQDFWKKTPAINATAEKDESSSRMTDEQKD